MLFYVMHMQDRLFTSKKQPQKAEGLEEGLRAGTCARALPGCAASGAVLRKPSPKCHLLSPASVEPPWLHLRLPATGASGGPAAAVALGTCWCAEGRGGTLRFG